MFHYFDRRDSAEQALSCCVSRAGELPVMASSDGSPRYLGSAANRHDAAQIALDNALSAMAIRRVRSACTGRRYWEVRV